MSAIRRFLLRLLNACLPGRAESELDHELLSHLRLLQDDFQRRGLSPVQSRLAAERALGGVARTKDQHRDARSFAWLDDTRRDLRHATRLLRRNPVFALTSAVSLAVGIGANTTVFSVANAVLLRSPVGVREPERLVDIGTSQNGAGFGPGSYPNYLDIRQRTGALEGVYAYPLFPQAMSLGLDNGRSNERVFATFVTVNYFTSVGAQPAVGRLFDASDSEQIGGAPIVVLAHAFWTNHFNQNPTVVGRTLMFDGHPFTVVGVAAQGFHGTGVRTADAWLPLNMISSMAAGSGAALENRAFRWLLVGGRLKPGIALKQAAAEMNAIGRSLEREYPDENRAAELRVEVASPVPGNAGVIAAFLALVMGIVLLVLVITCANVTSVLLTRSVARRREIAVRIAMGAGRRRLVRQLLLETAALFSVSGVGGLLLARVLTSLLIARLPALPFPVEVQLGLDRRAIVFTMGLVLLATVLSGLVPASQASKTDVISTLRDDSGSPQRLRLRQVFVTTQVALAIVLVTVAGLFVRALQRAGASDPGFDPLGVELASLNLSQAGYSDAGGRQFARELLDRVRTLPEVQAASLALVLPGGFETQGRAVTVPGVTPPHGQRYFNVDWNVVEPGYFATLRLPLVAGRDFSVDDREGTEPVAIVGEGTAKRFWPGQVAIGKALVQHVIGPRGRTTSARTMRVIGIAHDARTSSLIDGLSRSLVYVPLQQQYTPFLTIVARTTSGQRMAEEVRKEVGALNPRLPIVSSQTMEEWLALGLVPQRVVASVAGSLGMVGLLIAAIGIYGVTAYVVTTRTREMGIRIALGATRLDVIGLIMRQGMSLTIVGTASGLMLSAVSSRLLRGFLFDVQPIDPLAFIAATTLFVVIGSAACYLPARRATSIEAVEALRHD